MKKINPSFSIILSTFISVTIMVSYNRYVSSSRNYVEGKLLGQGVVHYNKEYIKSKENSIDNNERESQDEKVNNNSNTNLSNENHEKIKSGRDAYNEMHSRLEIEGLEDYYNRKVEQSVFKVSTGKIMEKLTIYDKVRLLYASMELGKETYKKVEAYLYADNAEAGVIKALKLLREELSEKEYKNVRKIAGKFIDMDAAESLY